MLRIDVRELRKGPVETSGVIPPSSPLIAGLELELAGPLTVTGRLEATGRNDFFWRGQFGGQARGTCRRCLRELNVPVQVSVEAVFSANPDLRDDPAVYPLTEPASHVDVADAVREELVLVARQYPLCREDCAGLCQHCGADLNHGPCGCAASRVKP